MLPSATPFCVVFWFVSLLLLREEHRLRVLGNRVLRRIFGPKRDEVTGEWRKLHNEELHKMYPSPNIIRQIKSRRMSRACGTHGRGEKSVQGFGGKTRRKETTRMTQGVGGRMGLEWMLGRLALGGVDWIRLSQDRDRLRAVVSEVMNLRVLAPRS
jgi:hypothetical protein